MGWFIRDKETALWYAKLVADAGPVGMDEPFAGLRRAANEPQETPETTQTTDSQGETQAIKAEGSG